MNTAFEGSSVWTAESSDKASFTYQLDSHTHDLFDALIAPVSDKPVETIQSADIDFAPLETILSTWHLHLRDGPGVLILSEFPHERFSRDELARIHWCIGLHLGTAVSQSVAGDLLGDVIGIGGKDHRERAYRNSTELAMHTDACDFVGMMCLQKAIEGGESGYVSGAAIYNEICRRSPELMTLLLRGFRYHRFGEEGPGESPVTEQPVPVFSIHEGRLSINYLRAYIDLASQEIGIPLTDDETRALDLVDEIAHSDRFAVKFTTEPGEAVFFNNLAVLHNRTAFEDSDRDELKRHLLRLWLVAHEPMAKAEILDMYEGRGIKKQAGRSSRLDGDLDYQEFAPKARN